MAAAGIESAARAHKVYNLRRRFGSSLGVCPGVVFLPLLRNPSAEERAAAASGKYGLRTLCSPSRISNAARAVPKYLAETHQRIKVETLKLLKPREEAQRMVLTRASCAVAG
jgi:hypothetical protein